MKPSKINKKDTAFSQLCSIIQLFKIFKTKGRYFSTYLLSLFHFSKILLSTIIKLNISPVLSYFTTFIKFSKQANIQVIFLSKTEKTYQKVGIFLPLFLFEKLWYNFIFNKITSLIMSIVYFFEQTNICLANYPISSSAKYFYFTLLFKFKNFKPNSINKKDLCTYLQLTEKAVQNHLKELEENNLLKRSHNTVLNGNRKVGNSLFIQLVIPNEFLLMEAI